MRRIPLRTLPDPAHPPGDPQYDATVIEYRAVITQCLRAPLNRQQGASIDEMRKCIRVLDALEAADGDVLELEDADWEMLKQKVEAMPWGWVDRRIVRFHDDVADASERLPESVNGRVGEPALQR